MNSKSHIENSAMPINEITPNNEHDYFHPPSVNSGDGEVGPHVKLDLTGQEAIDRHKAEIGTDYSAKLRQANVDGKKMVRPYDEKRITPETRRTRQTKFSETAEITDKELADVLEDLKWEIYRIGKLIAECRQGQADFLPARAGFSAKKQFLSILADAGISESQIDNTIEKTETWYLNIWEKIWFNKMFRATLKIGHLEWKINQIFQTVRNPESQEDAAKAFVEFRESVDDLAIESFEIISTVKNAVSVQANRMTLFSTEPADELRRVKGYFNEWTSVLERKLHPPKEQDRSISKGGILLPDEPETQPASTRGQGGIRLPDDF